MQILMTDFTHFSTLNMLVNKTDFKSRLWMVLMRNTWECTHLISAYGWSNYDCALRNAEKDWFFALLTL